MDLRFFIVLGKTGVCLWVFAVLFIRSWEKRPTWTQAIKFATGYTALWMIVMVIMMIIFLL